ncbi:amidohydrolase [Pseudorhodobacter sp.]|uniref:amidohydrolase n=1 Tax=Pseudorhodobacter sp. TaxID=1934400 RepID=UPI00264973D8|nr:amidohydrolase [Pseudorhodobacter sp.]MDN5787140.1 amidohydrolase [Pseudorhodobacter sp.]
MRNSDEIWPLVEAHEGEFVTLANAVFDTPEVAYTEAKSCAAHLAQLKAEGARISENLAGIPTAIMGEWGQGGPVVAILGEYDALPGLGQVPGVAEAQPLGYFGHGCGHNLLGSAAMLAAVALRDWLAQSGKPGRVRFYGCPAEEGGAAKAFMVRAGLFADIDAAITWHPNDFTGIMPPRALANMRIDFTFHGRSAHAAGSPELGRSGLDAVELMNVGVNYMREDMPDDARVHYAYLDAGGEAPNVVQAKATVRQLIRSPSNKGLRDLVARVRKIGEGAALMTETRVEARVVSAVSSMLSSPVLEQAMEAQILAIGAPEFDDADRAFAADIQQTLTPEHIADTFWRAGREVEPKVLADFVVKLADMPDAGAGSTDVADVSWAVPTVQAYVATCAIGTPFHSWQLTAQGKSTAAHKGMAHAAKIMAATGRDLFARPDLLAEAKAEHATNLAREPYVCPLEPEVMPPIPGHKA